MEGTTIWVSKETKKFLDSLRTKSYDEAIRKLITSGNPQAPYVISLTRTVPAETWVTKEDNYKEVPFTGRIVSCNIFTPPGCEDLVFIRIGVGSSALSDWIQSGDNKSLTIPLNRDVAKKEIIWAEIMNKDTTYPHTPTIEFIIVPLEVKVI